MASQLILILWFEQSAVNKIVVVGTAGSICHRCFDFAFATAALGPRCPQYTHERLSAGARFRCSCCLSRCCCPSHPWTSRDRL